MPQWGKRGEEFVDLINRFGYRFVAAEMYIEGRPGRPGEALKWFDGRDDDTWTSVTSKVVVRFKEPQVTSGIVLVAKAMNPGTVQINAKTRVVLPAIKRTLFGDGGGVVVLRFERKEKVYQLLFDTLGGGLCLYEIFLLGRDE